MNTRVRLLVFAAGAAVFFFLVQHVGPAVLLANIRRAGWTLAPIVLLWVPIFLCWNASWWLTMRGAANPPPFWRVLVVGIAGHSINEVTPFAQVGGEPFRVAAMSPWLGVDRATSSVVTYYMLHALTNMAIWVAGILLVIAHYHPPLALRVPLVALAAAIAALMAFVLARHRQGVVTPLVDLVRRIPVLRRFALPLEQRRPQLETLDRLITGFYHESPSRFALAFLADLIGRGLSTLEYWFMGRGLGVDVSLVQAFAIGSFGALAINLVFFMPMQAGTKEGGLYFAFRLVGLDAKLGVFAAVFQRLRELTWIAIGLVLILVAGERETLRKSRAEG